MTIKVGDRLPAGTLQEYYDVETNGCAIGPNPLSIESLTRGKKVVIFGLPGAFTPTCSAKHVPSYLAAYDKLKAKGVDTIACIAVNDAWVMDAWAKDQGADDIVMLADGSGEFAKAMGLEFDGSGFGLGQRSQRYAAVIEDGTITKLEVEPKPGVDVSSCDSILDKLG